jgi:hypothetical protein
VVGTAQLSQPNVPDTSANSHGPSERMDILSVRSFSMSEEGGSSWSSRPCRHHLALLFALLASRMETGAEPATREAHGLQPNSRHVPSRKSAPKSRKTRSDKVFRWALSEKGSHMRKRVNLRATWMCDGMTGWTRTHGLSRQTAYNEATCM